LGFRLRAWGLGVSGFGFQGSGFGFWVRGFKIQDFGGFKVYSFSVQGFGVLRFLRSRDWVLGFLGLGFRV